MVESYLLAFVGDFGEDVEEFVEVFQVEVVLRRAETQVVDEVFLIV